MVTSCSPKMPQTIEAYRALSQRDLEIIMDQKEEIDRLKQENLKLQITNRKLSERVKALRGRIE